MEASGSALAGRRVVVTRAAEQADGLAELLQQCGAIPVLIPLIEVVTTPAQEQLAEQAASDFDWLIVTSPNGAKSLLTASVQLSPRTRVAAIGATTADVLRAGGIEVAVVPVVQSAVGLLAEFPSAAGRVLIVQAENAETTLADTLTGNNWTVTVVAPYRTVPARVTAGQQLSALSADAVLFASGSAARAWADVFGDSTPPVVVAIGPQTAAAATDAGLKVSAVAADHSLSGMVKALEHQLLSQR